jgi:hypothetical protein
MTWRRSDFGTLYYQQPITLCKSSYHGLTINIYNVYMCVHRIQRQTPDIQRGEGEKREAGNAFEFSKKMEIVFAQTPPLIDTVPKIRFEMMFAPPAH